MYCKHVCRLAGVHLSRVWPCSGGPPPPTGCLFKTYLQLSFILTSWNCFPSPGLSYCAGFRKKHAYLINLSLFLRLAFFQDLVLLYAAHPLHLLISLHPICHHLTMFHGHHLPMFHRTMFHCHHRTMFH